MTSRSQRELADKPTLVICNNEECFCLRGSTDVTKALPPQSSRVWTQSLWGHFWTDYSAASFKKSHLIFYQASVPWWWCHPSEAPSRFNWIPSWGETLPSEGAADLPATVFALTRTQPCSRGEEVNAGDIRAAALQTWIKLRVSMIESAKRGLPVKMSAQQLWAEAADRLTAL